MDLLHAPPPGFDSIANMFAMAKLLPSSHRLDVKIGFAHAGVLVAAGRLDGYRQVKFLVEHVRELGWREHLLGGDAEMHGCDMLFAHPGEADAHAEDPSFIRRTPVQLWPARDPQREP